MATQILYLFWIHVDYLVPQQNADYLSHIPENYKTAIENLKR